MLQENRNLTIDDGLLIKDEKQWSGLQNRRHCNGQSADSNFIVTPGQEAKKSPRLVGIGSAILFWEE